MSAAGWEKRKTLEKWAFRGACPSSFFGSLEFVTAAVFALGDRFRSRSVAAREVGGLGYATHGWRLAKAAERAA